MRDATEPTQTTKGLSLLAKVSNPKGIRNTFYWKHSFSSNKDPSTVFYINTLHSRGILISIKVNIIFPNMLEHIKSFILQNFSSSSDENKFRRLKIYYERHSQISSRYWCIQPSKSVLALDWMQLDIFSWIYFPV